ncbi:Microsomal glutathione S-transferase 3 [Phytophthora boehmeriae]|uniref:Glutathione S-transferase 3, mitochondrial n=1 Tax=Phytophthora boehmeriae TaxID=109152 RepID=A0A8T1X6C3_9STRA|nr:Microsomal glutathione S-transferase 3 [Phytophthora boehmeriae]
MSVSAVRVTLQPAHGYIPLVVIGAGLVSTWAGIKVGAARKKFNVPYPQMYADKKDKNATEFNCTQRAHQNVLENIPVFYAMLATASIYRPKLAAAAGAIRIAGFIMYVKGYSSGDPGKRRQGNFGHLGTLVLLGLSTEAAIRLLGYL